MDKNFIINNGVKNKLILLLSVCLTMLELDKDPKF